MREVLESGGVRKVVEWWQVKEVAKEERTREALTLCTTRDPPLIITSAFCEGY